MVETMNKWSPVALGICLFCDFLWCVLVMGFCTYIVFWMNQSGWWYLFAIFLCTSWSCKSYRSPEQIAASCETEETTKIEEWNEK